MKSTWDVEHLNMDFSLTAQNGFFYDKTPQIPSSFHDNEMPQSPKWQRMWALKIMYVVLWVHVHECMYVDSSVTSLVSRSYAHIYTQWPVEKLCLIYSHGYGNY